MYDVAVSDVNDYPTVPDLVYVSAASDGLLSADWGKNVVKKIGGLNEEQIDATVSGSG